MTHPQRRSRSLLAALLGLAVVGLVLVVIVLSSSGGGSGGSGSHRSAGARPPAAAGASRPASKPQAPVQVTQSDPGVPQQNGGDADPDNNGGPDDGDGGI
jgi:hypothetical protein